MEKQIENMTDQELVDYLFDKVDVKKTIYKMLTENTGTHFLDSGGASNRNWQRNQIKTIKPYKKTRKNITTMKTHMKTIITT